MKCPDCDGGIMIASHVAYANKPHGYNVPMNCLRCNGTGIVDDRTPEWMKAGEALRQSRLKANRILRDEAARLGMDASTLSRMERGVIEPYSFGLSPEALAEIEAFLPA